MGTGLARGCFFLAGWHLGHFSTSWAYLEVGWLLAHCLSWAGIRIWGEVRAIGAQLDGLLLSERPTGQGVAAAPAAAPSAVVAVGWPRLTKLTARVSSTPAARPQRLIRECRPLSLGQARRRLDQPR